MPTTLLRLKIHRDVDDLRVGCGQASWRWDRADISRHLADADIEGKVRMLPLRHAHGVVQRGGQMRLAGHQTGCDGRMRPRFLTVRGSCVKPAEGTATIPWPMGSGIPRPPKKRPPKRVLWPPMPKMVALVAFQPMFARNGTGFLAQVLVTAM